jgi:hypothetical protein
VRALPALTVLALVIGFGAIGYGVWKLLPRVHGWLMSTKSRILESERRPAPRKTPVRVELAPGDTAEVAQLKEEIRRVRAANKELLEENLVLRRQLEGSSNSITGMLQEIDELKLQLLILTRTREGSLNVEP